ncbi:alpha/beta fold hydrolase [Corynebacterium uterequi]|uniref:Lysophospholipase n=1 Tax=Corynebacterium uterequi TaxID=1072256 RepID=A0A0G3HHZ0_9CORY|nr:alpha/beta hydrolase [Corynebacterium uterequi]AKK10747.1 lysophospholipase [Corynebacterium uterequi]
MKTSPTVMVTHGVTDSAECLTSLIDTLAPIAPTQGIDLPGHGDSPRIHHLDDPIEEMADYLQAKVAPQAPVILIAHSMGAAVSTVVAARRPDLVSALVVEDPAWLTTEQAARYRADGEHSARRLAEIAAAPAAARAGLLADYPHCSPADADGWLKAKLSCQREFVATGIVGVEDWRRVVGALSCPTLLITGDGDDILIGPRRAQEIREEYPLIETAVIPGARHSVRLDAPGHYYQVLRRWLAARLAA